MTNPDRVLEPCFWCVPWFKFTFSVRVTHYFSLISETFAAIIPLIVETFRTNLPFIAETFAYLWCGLNRKL
jgi:hypothetical protein